MQQLLIQVLGFVCESIRDLGRNDLKLLEPILFRGVRKPASGLSVAQYKEVFLKRACNLYPLRGAILREAQTKIREICIRDIKMARTRKV